MPRRTPYNPGRIRRLDRVRRKALCMKFRALLEQPFFCQALLVPFFSVHECISLCSTAKWLRQLIEPAMKGKFCQFCPRPWRGSAYHLVCPYFYGSFPYVTFPRPNYTNSWDWIVLLPWPAETKLSKTPKKLQQPAHEKRHKLMRSKHLLHQPQTRHQKSRYVPSFRSAYNLSKH